MDELDLPLDLTVSVKSKNVKVYDKIATKFFEWSLCIIIMGSIKIINHETLHTGYVHGIESHYYIMLTLTKLKAEHTVLALLSRVDCSG